MPNLNEADRLDTLRRLNLLEMREGEAFDRITRLASRLFDVPVALITLVDKDRQWFKSRVGTQIRDIPVEQAFCKYAILSDEVTVVPNATQDPRFEHNPLVTEDPSIRFYAGAPLITHDGFGIGTMCVLDTKPREMTEADKKVLADLAAMVMAQIDLAHALGHIDAFSGLPNRNQLYEDLDDLSREQLHAPYLLVVADIIGIDRIETILRTLGSTHSDALIRNSAKILREMIGEEVKLYHLDTARYVFLLPDNAERKWLDVIAQISACFTAPIACDGVPVDVNLSVGVCPFELGQLTGPDIVRMAVTAALDARETERDWSLYSPVTDEAHRRSFTLLADMSQALKTPGQLALFYQPRIDLHDAAQTGCEALLRWKHPTLGNISPGEFIPLVEQTALAEPVTQWVIHAALSQIAQWRSSGINAKVSVNVSARNLEEKDFADKLQQALQRHQVRPEWIELEFTESALMRNGDRILEQLCAIKEMGVEIAIDDFGTGYSNYSYLQQIPASIVKLDQSLIRSVASNPRDQVIVRAMIAMAHDLGYRVVAEGVETQAEQDLLHEWACDELQGYFIARPMDAEAFAGWLRAFLERDS